MTTLIARCAAALLPLLTVGVLAIAPGPAAAAGTAQVAAISRTDVVSNAVDGYIRPAYGDLAAAAADMARRQDALCAAPTREMLHAARQGFAALVTAFSRIEYVRFGPIMDDNRIERMLFWPDRRGVALRQVQAILADRDETAAETASLHGKSVAVQGLNALEFVLFGTDADALAGPGDGFRCRYGAAIAGNVETMTGTISRGWQATDGIAEAMLHPGPSSPAYRDTDDALQEIIGVFIHGMEAIRDLRIKPAMGESAEKSNPKSWIYQRSELTDASLHANFAGLSELYDRSSIADLLPAPQSWVKASIGFEFGNAGRTFQTIGMPVAKAAADPKARDRVGYLLILTQSLQDLFALQLAPPLGLTAGFSSLDGD